MKQSEALKILQKLKKQWQIVKYLESAMFSLALSLLLLAVLYLFTPFSFLINTLVFCLTFFGLFIILVEAKGIRNFGEKKLSLYLNQKYKELENSTELLLEEEDNLNRLSLLQKNKINRLLPELEKEIQLPHQVLIHSLYLALAFFFATFIFIFGKNLLTFQNVQASGQQNNPYQKTKALSVLPPAVKTAKLIISPPAYTALGAFESKDLHIKAPEESKISWSFQFKGKIKKAYLFFQNKDTLWLKNKNEIFEAEKVLKEKGFYELQFLDEKDELHSSDYYALEPVKDEKPKVLLTGIEQYTDLKFATDLKISFQANMQDDYGIRDAYIVATVSKGSGEAVKFREEKLYFNEKLKAGSKNSQLTKNIRLQDLGMSPGDELYFYVEASDNRSPKPQKGRTEMYFVALQDTARQVVTMEMSTGINQMPEYFRSQRQLIIDTEKLLAQKNRISKEEFQERSNNIGVDQKILRLRYGQFLGEEFESAIGGHSHNHNYEEELHYDGDGHDHKHEGHNKWMERWSSMKILEKNEKDHEQNKDKNNLFRDVPEEVMHIHDIQEEASFLDESLKAELRAVLNLMWDSELRLRTIHPKESLPFQYRALYLLKQIQQKSRIYVERVGFEPPPLEEKNKRLSGDLKKIENKSTQKETKTEALYPHIKKALTYLENCRQTAQIPDKEGIKVLQEAGLELAQIAIEKPGLYLKSLRIIKKITEGQLKKEEIRQNIPYLLQSLWSALPKENPQAGKETGKRNNLTKMYLKRIGG